MSFNNDTLFNEWVIILRCIKLNDLTIHTLFKLCTDYKTDFQNCYKHLLIVSKMPYNKARIYVNNILESLLINIPFPPVPPLCVSSQFRISLSLKELEVCKILSNMS